MYQNTPQPQYGNAMPHYGSAAPQYNPQPQYGDYNGVPPQQHQVGYIPPTQYTHDTYSSPPAVQPVYSAPVDFVPTGSGLPVPPALTPAAAGLAAQRMESNPFGPGSLPQVTPVTQQMRTRKALQIAQRYLDQGLVTAPQVSGKQPTDVSPAAASSAAAELVHIAATEHNVSQLEMTDNLADHEARLGSGILYLFSFVRFLFWLSIAFAVFQCVTFGDYIRRHSPDFGFAGLTAAGTDKIWLDNFMISGYDTDHDKKLWLAMNILCIVITFFSAPIYFWWLRWSEQTSKYVDVDGEDVILRFTADGRIDVSNLYRSNAEVFVRRILSSVVVFIMIGIQVVASYFITQNAVTNIGISFAISIVVAILNMLFLLIAERLTEFECWVSFEHWKRYHTMKLLFFRLSNIITVFAAKRYDSSENVKCAYDLIGQQFITLLLIDIFAVNLQQIVMNMLWNKYAERFADWSGSIFGNQDNLPKFDIALEYLQVVYRQYLVIMAMVVCPFSIFLSMVGFIIDYLSKKFILVKLSGVPRKVESSQKNFLTAILVFIAVCALLTPFAGSVFLLSGMTRDKSTVCTFP